MTQILQAYEKMLLSWNIRIVWPSKMPTKPRYNFLLKFVLIDKIAPMGSGIIYLDYCTGYAPDCDWGEYCSCLKYWGDHQDS